MKLILSDQNVRILRFDRGEEVISSLIAFAKENTIQAATFTLIGACSEVTLAYYNLKEKKYIDKTMFEDMEIVSVTGNIGVMDDKPLIHAHGIFSDSDLGTHGGHIKKLTISATGELHLMILSGELKRAFDEETGLNVLS